MSTPGDRPGDHGSTAAIEHGRAPADLAAAYAELHGLLLERPDVNAFLQQAAVLAASVIPGSSCGITLRRDHQLTTVANSDGLALQVDEIQYGTGQGPCLDAARTGTVVSVPDLATENRWGRYRVHALTYGVRSSLSLPMVIEGDARGALNLYAPQPNRFSDTDAERGGAFVLQLTTALTLVLRTADQQVLEDQLRDAIVTRAVIDQAVGIIMGQHRVNAAAAFAVLRQASQTRNRKLRDVAADLVESTTGEPPVPPRPFTDRR